MELPRANPKMGAAIARASAARHTVTHMVASGTLLDRFRIENELGEGGMGTVYQALDTRLHRRIALKIIRRDSTMSSEAWDDAKARLLREARAAAAFAHPNVVSIYDLGEADGVPFIAMELIVGKTLREYVGSTEVSWSQKLAWLLDSARALGAAHRVGLVHRDIKPENIMVSVDGRVKVLDFGIARRASMDLEGPAPSTGSILALTGNGRLVGTPLYMAPEYITGRRLDGCADQFAWGVTAYELFSGFSPWSGANTVALMAAVLLEPPARLDCAELPEAVEAAILRTLAKDPADRHASMEALVELLEPLAAARTPTPVPPRQRPALDTGAPTAMPVVVVPRRPGSTMATGAVAAVAVAAAVAAAGVWRFWLADREPPHVALSAAVVPLADKPVSQNAEAATAYRSGVQAVRDASIGAARHRFEQAVALDSSLAAAHLRLAPLLLWHRPTLAREHFQKASQLRASLDAIDEALLEAIEPLVGRDPSDEAEGERRLAAAVSRFPASVELAYYLAMARSSQGRFREAGEALAQAIVADPKSALAWYAKADVEGSGGTHDAAVQALDRCLELAPTATACLHRRMLIAELDGRCADAERDGKRWISANPESAFAYRWLAEVSFGSGRSADTALEHLKQAWARSPEPERRATELEDRATLDQLAGDFVSADKRLRELDQVTADSPDLHAHALPAWSLVRLYGETGNTARAVSVADEYLRRKDAWVIDPDSSRATERDFTPRIIRAVGQKNAAAAVRSREEIGAWARKTETELAPARFGLVWINAYAATVETPDEARTALAALPGPLPWFRAAPSADALVGRVYRLAGRVSEALPELERAAKSCRAFDDPTGWVQVHAWLAAAKSQSGDTRGACAEYQVVLSRWGTATPTSLTAREARAQMAALHCAP